MTVPQLFRLSNSVVERAFYHFPVRESFFLRRASISRDFLWQLCADGNSLTFWSLLDTSCTNRFDIQQMYALSTLYLCVYYLSENKRLFIPLYIIHWSAFITQMNSVYIAVRTGSLNIAVCASSLTLSVPN
jgi:hypothetical protein